MKQLITILSIIGFLFPLNAQDEQTPSPIIFIYDASGSMWGQMQGKTKMTIAADVLSGAVTNLPENQKIGLVAYGHRQKGDCEDVEFLVNVENGSKAMVNQSIANIKPLGKTPLAYSALQVIDKLRNTQTKATIILVTDGIESCGGNICDVIKAAKEEGIDFKLHIIGFGLKDAETGQLRCAAKAGDGQYYDAVDADKLSEVLNEATATTVDDPTENFSVYAIKNGKPIDAYINAFSAGTKTSVTVSRTYADTAFMHLPPGKYDLEIKPLEHSDVNTIIISGVQSLEGKIVHKDISFDGGKIKVTATNNGEGWDATVTVFAKGSKKHVARGRTYKRSEAFELNPGIYDVEIKALKIEGAETIHIMEDVEVTANKTDSLTHDFKSGIAMIGAKDSEGLVDAVVKIREPNSGKQVAGSRTYTSEKNNPRQFILNPGTYEVTVSPVRKHSGKKETFTITVNAGESVEKISTF